MIDIVDFHNEMIDAVIARDLKKLNQLTALTAYPTALGVLLELSLNAFTHYLNDIEVQLYHPWSAALVEKLREVGWSEFKHALFDIMSEYHRSDCLSEDEIRFIEILNDERNDYKMPELDFLVNEMRKPENSNWASEEGASILDRFIMQGHIYPDRLMTFFAARLEYKRQLREQT